MRTENFCYQDKEQTCKGFLALDDQNTQKRPAVLVIHDWTGRNEFACEKAKKMVGLGYVGFAIDVYGDGQLGESLEEKQSLIEPFFNNRAYLRERLRAGLNALSTIPEVDSDKIAVIGFCFGGLCALDIARSGAQIKGTVSFHGLLNKAEELDNAIIQSKILVLHGYDDPMSPPEAVNTFCEEMTDAKADWQVHMYGGTMHAFTNPIANDPKFGTVYNEVSERRSWLSLKNFLEEIFE